METPRRVFQTVPCNDKGSISPSLIFGLVIVAIGVLFLLDNFGVPVGIVWQYWPLALIAIGLAKLVDSRTAPGRTWGAILMIVGIVLIADQIHLPFLNNISLWNLWPLGLIIFGGMMLWNALEGKGLPNRVGAAACRLNQFAVFGGGKRKIIGDFEGGSVFAFCGGYELDLRKATMPSEEAVLEANAMFGGFEIKVPETWSVTMQVTGIFGGHEDSTAQPDRTLVPNPKRLIIRGATVFGGLGVKN